MAETGQPTRSTPGGAGMGGPTTGSQGGAGTGGTGPGSMTGGGAGMGGSSTGGSGTSGAGAGAGGSGGRSGMGGSSPGGSGMGGAGAGGSGSAGGSAGARTGAGSGSGGSGSTQPGDLKSIASDVASEIANTATEQGRGLLQAAKGSATSFVDQRKDTAAQSIADLASSLRDSGKGFEEQPSLKAFVGTAADGLEQLATGLRDRSFADIYGDVESIARRQPVTFAAGAAIAGFLLARFIKSSAEEMSVNNAARAQSARSSRTAGRPHAAAGGAGTARG